MIYDKTLRISFYLRNTYYEVNKIDQQNLYVYRQQSQQLHFIGIFMTIYLLDFSNVQKGTGEYLVADQVSIAKVVKALCGTRLCNSWIMWAKLCLPQ